jgi:hypothetical protein
MSNMAVRQDGMSRAPFALFLGALSAVGFFGLGFAVGGWWFLIALVIGGAAVVVGVPARRRAVTKSERRVATVGLVLGAVVVAWFVIYMAVAAIASAF